VATEIYGAQSFTAVTQVLRGFNMWAETIGGVVVVAMQRCYARNFPSCPLRGNMLVATCMYKGQMHTVSSLTPFNY
jgi:hypothetical protein